MVALLACALLFDRHWSGPTVFCILKDPRVTESSGIAESLSTPGVFNSIAILGADSERDREATDLSVREWQRGNDLVPWAAVHAFCEV